MISIEGLKRFASTPIGLMVFGIGGTLGSIITYRYLIGPKLEKRRRYQSEEFAEYLFQQEIKDHEK